MRALGEPGCHEGERSGLAGHPRRGLRGRSGSSARPWAWKLPSMRGTPWNLPPGTATGSSYSAPATATSSSTAATATAPSRCSRWTTWIRRGRAGPRRRRATRRAGVRRHLDLAHLPGARREHPQPGRPHGVAGRQEDSGRTRSTCGMSATSVHGRVANMQVPGRSPLQSRAADAAAVPHGPRRAGLSVPGEGRKGMPLESQRRLLLAAAFQFGTRSTIGPSPRARSASS